MKKAFVITCISFLLCFQSFAHEVRPVYLEVKQKSFSEYFFKLKVPARGDTRFDITVVVPETCDTIQNFRRIKSGNAFIDTWTLNCDAGIEGKELILNGIQGTLTDALVRIELLDGNEQTALLKPENPMLTVHKDASFKEVVIVYLRLGIEHILFGIDHLLFVFGLLLITKGKWRMLKTVTAFTVAHSFTLILASLGLVNIPGAPVEAVIALSIVFVAYEALHIDNNDTAIKRPWIVAFVFGLLHGFGFAGALSETGLPQNSIASALFFFNVGVEIGQIVFITVVLIVVTLSKSRIQRFPQWVYKIPPYVIGSLAMFWVFQRIAAF